MYLSVTQGESGLWSVKLIGANGEIMLSSETYDNKWNAERAAYNIQGEWASTDSIEVRIFES